MVDQNNRVGWLRYAVQAKKINPNTSYRDVFGYEEFSSNFYSRDIEADHRGILIANYVSEDA